VTIVSFRNTVTVDYGAASSTGTPLSVGLRLGALGSSGDGERLSVAYDNVALDLVW